MKIFLFLPSGERNQDSSESEPKVKSLPFSHPQLNNLISLLFPHLGTKCYKHNNSDPLRLDLAPLQ